MSGEPDWADELAIDLLAQSRGGTLGEFRQLLAAKLRLVKQEGVCDGLAKAQDAVKEAFKK